MDFCLSDQFFRSYARLVWFPQSELFRVVVIVFSRTDTMAVATTGHNDPCSVDVLDFLFNHDGGILTEDGGFNLEENDLQLPNLGLVR